MAAADQVKCVYTLSELVGGQWRGIIRAHNKTIFAIKDLKLGVINYIVMVNGKRTQNVFSIANLTVRNKSEDTM